MSIGTVLIFQSISLLIATFLGVKILASYSFTVQIVNFLTVFTTMFLNLHIPELTFLYATKNKFKIKEILDKAHVINFVLYILGILFILFFSDLFFKLIEKNNLLLKGYDFGLIIILYFFESNMTLSTTFLIATNKIPFLKSSLVSGLLITVISFLFLKFTKANLTSILFVQLFIQVVYNYWKWTFMIIKEYSINIFDAVKFRNT
jgi:O-antigen/teichoic acid export membrane protein